MENDEREKALIASIVKVFPDPGFPHSNSVTPCRCSECEEITAYLRDSFWRGRSVEDLRYHEAALSLFENEAFEYFLPAFLVAAVEDPEAADVILDGIPFHLDRAREVRNYTPVQRQVVAEFMRWMLDEFSDYDGKYSRLVEKFSRPPHAG